MPRRVESSDHYQGGPVTADQTPAVLSMEELANAHRLAVGIERLRAQRGYQDSIGRWVRDPFAPTVLLDDAIAILATLDIPPVSRESTEADEGRPRLDPAIVATDSGYMAGMVRGRELEREARENLGTPEGAGLDVLWAEAEAALPEGGWLTVGTVAPGLVTIEAMHWPDGERNRSIARAFKMPMLAAVLSIRDQLRAYHHEPLPPYVVEEQIIERPTDA